MDKQEAEVYLNEITKLQEELQQWKNDDQWRDIRTSLKDTLIVVIGGYWDCYTQQHGLENINPTLVKFSKIENDDTLWYAGDNAFIRNPTKFMYVSQDIIGELK